MSPAGRFLFLACLWVCLLLGSNTVNAFEERTFDSPEDEKTFDSLVAELRCLVCQNQNIADSDADLAVDLRREIYSMIGEGKSKSDIKDFMVQRYGEFVLYKPRFNARTLVLWLGPGILLLIGGFVLYRSTVNNRKHSENSPDDAALVRARKLLDDD